MLLQDCGELSVILALLMEGIAVSLWHLRNIPLSCLGEGGKKQEEQTKKKLQEEKVALETAENFFDGVVG